MLLQLSIFLFSVVINTSLRNFPVTRPLLLFFEHLCDSVPCFLSQERKLCAFPSVEIYRSDVINYMVPLSHQMDFFVPEMKEEVKTDVKEEESDEDRGTDITGITTEGSQAGS